MLIDIITTMVFFTVACVCAFSALRVFRRTNNKKLRAKKLAVWTVLLCVLLGVSYEMYTVRRDWGSQFTTEVDLMNEKFENIDGYQFYDWAENMMYEFPSPWPDEFPFTIKYVNAYNDVGELEINSYEDLPISLDEVWYWYGTQETVASETPEEAYYAFTHGQILSSPSKNMEQQVFTFADANGTLQNIYIINFPYNNPTVVYTDELWFVCMWSLIGSLCVCFGANVYAINSHLKDIKKIKKGGK